MINSVWLLGHIDIPAVCAAQMAALLSNDNCRELHRLNSVQAEEAEEMREQIERFSLCFSPLEMNADWEFPSLQEQVAQLTNRLSVETTLHQQDVNILIVCLGDLVQMLTNQDLISHMRMLVREWEDSIRGQAAAERIVQGERVIDQLQGQRARWRSSE